MTATNQERQETHGIDDELGAGFLKGKNDHPFLVVVSILHKLADQ